MVEEGRTLPDFPAPGDRSELLDRRYFEVAWPVLSALCGLSFPSLRKLVVDLDVLDSQYCDAHSVVFRWLQDDLPAGLELLKFGGEEMCTTDRAQLREWEQTHQQGLLDRYVHLKGLQWIEYEPLPKACFDPDGMLQTLEVLVWGDYFRGDDDELKQLASFGKLRMLEIQMSEPTAEDLANLCEAVPASVEVLYLSMRGGV